VRSHCRQSSRPIWPRPNWRRGYRLALIALGLALGCTRANPAYLGPHPPNDGGVNDAPADIASDTTTVDTGVDRGADRGPDTVAADTKIDTNKPDVQADAGDAGDAAFVCANAGQCTSHFGAAPCGTWTCPAGACVLNCPNCTDLDGDGYGVGTGCAGPDCDDSDPTVSTSAPPRICPAGAVIVLQGTCRAGTQSCTAGVWSACSGQVVPSGEACNGEDDNCDGMADNNLPTLSCGLGACKNTIPSCGAGGVLAVCAPHAALAADDSLCDGIDNDCDGLVDEDCQAACLHVSPDGDDNTGNGSALAPYQSIPMAIAMAGSTGKNVCVAGGLTCQDHATYTVANGPPPLNVFQMADGVSLYGNFESTGWTRCDVAGAAPNPTTTLDLRESSGVRFSNLIKPTTLDGFVLTRNSSGSPAAVAAVTVNGATKVQLSNLVVNDSASANLAYGVYLINGAKALITHSLIYGGAGTMASYGVLSVNSTPEIRENCASIDPTTGRCTTDCAATPGMAIGGRIGAATMGDSAAVLLQSSPGALVATSTICGAQGSQAAGVHITGDATGTVIRGSSISASAGAGSSFGVFVEACSNAAPWIVGNNLIQGQGSGSIAGVVAQGRCAPVIDGNALITNGGDSTTIESDGVLCQADLNGQASACAVLGNKQIQGLSGSRPLVSAGIACKAGACVRVADNVVNGGAAVNNVYGVWLLKNGTMVERNRIAGGCSQTAVGLLADDSYTRIQNNLITAGSCAGNTLLTASPTNIGLRVFGANDQNEIDINSNTIDGGGNAGLVTCTSTAVALDTGTNTPPTAPKGIIRNNIMSGGVCNSLLTLSNLRTDFAEAKTTTDPRVFQNNDLDPSGTGALTLYLDEGATAQTSADAVNKLPDITTGGNISLDPKFASPPTDLRLGAGSPCIGAGTPTGAPATDFEGKTRSPTTTTKPSIGAYQ
jgi:hypothetical protein